MKNSLNANHKKWYVIDAKGKTLGKLATIIATILNGKHKSINNPSLDCGDYVIVINSKDIKVTGKKSPLPSKPPQNLTEITTYSTGQNYGLPMPTKRTFLLYLLRSTLRLDIKESRPSWWSVVSKGSLWVKRRIN